MKKFVWRIYIRWKLFICLLYDFIPAQLYILKMNIFLLCDIIPAQLSIPRPSLWWRTKVQIRWGLVPVYNYTATNLRGTHRLFMAITLLPGWNQPNFKNELSLQLLNIVALMYYLCGRCSYQTKNVCLCSNQTIRIKGYSSIKSSWLYLLQKYLW